MRHLNQFSLVFGLLISLAVPGYSQVTLNGVVTAINSHRKRVPDVQIVVTPPGTANPVASDSRGIFQLNFLYSSAGRRVSINIAMPGYIMTNKSRYDQFTLPSDSEHVSLRIDVCPILLWRDIVEARDQLIKKWMKSNYVARYKRLRAAGTQDQSKYDNIYQEYTSNLDAAYAIAESVSSINLDYEPTKMSRVTKLFAAGRFKVVLANTNIDTLESQRKLLDEANARTDQLADNFKSEAADVRKKGYKELSARALVGVEAARIILDFDAAEKLYWEAYRLDSTNKQLFASLGIFLYTNNRINSLNTLLKNYSNAPRSFMHIIYNGVPDNTIENKDFSYDIILRYLKLGMTVKRQDYITFVKEANDELIYNTDPIMDNPYLTTIEKCQLLGISFDMMSFSFTTAAKIGLIPRYLKNPSRHTLDSTLAIIAPHMGTSHNLAQRFMRYYVAGFVINCTSKFFISDSDWVSMAYMQRRSVYYLDSALSIQDSLKTTLSKTDMIDFSAGFYQTEVLGLEAELASVILDRIIRSQDYAGFDDDEKFCLLVLKALKDNNIEAHIDRLYNFNTKLGLIYYRLNRLALAKDYYMAALSNLNMLEKLNSTMINYPREKAAIDSSLKICNIVLQSK